jgi:SNF2 family DNA or RNA helicase
MRVTNRIGLSSFKMQIRQQRDWFAASGELQISDDEVLDMQRLMELLEVSPGRFVKLQEGQFLALTQEFRKRLDELRAFSEKNGKGVRFHPLASLAMEDWMDEVGQLKTDKHWKQHVKRLKEAQDLKPEVPSTLQAELRDYQVEGFEWLARLAHWGVGACLADDMGLGKTLQALAVILTRAPEGPTLIVAPTSVCMNWLSEAEKFAPTLNPMQFGSGDRQKLLDNLQPFDMLVCSYGLLQQEDERNAGRGRVANHRAGRGPGHQKPGHQTLQGGDEAAGGLQGDHHRHPHRKPPGRTVEPVSVHQSGLLGSLDQFNQRFANAIERHQDKQARKRLKKLIQPFILRRTKTQVLDELPARTEVTLQVELSAQEMAFYEAIAAGCDRKTGRHRRPGRGQTPAGAGRNHAPAPGLLQHPAGKGPDAALPSAKLEAFGEIWKNCWRITTRPWCSASLSITSPSCGSSSMAKRLLPVPGRQHPR